MKQHDLLTEFMDDLKYNHQYGQQPVKEILVAPTVYAEIIKEAIDAYNMPIDLSDGSHYTYRGVRVKCGIDENIIYQA